MRYVAGTCALRVGDFCVGTDLEVVDDVDARECWLHWSAMKESWLLCVSGMRCVTVPIRAQGCVPHRACSWGVAVASAVAGVGDDAHQGAYVLLLATAMRWLWLTLSI